MILHLHTSPAHPVYVNSKAIIYFSPRTGSNGTEIQLRRRHTSINVIESPEQILKIIESNS